MCLIDKFFSATNLKRFLLFFESFGMQARFKRMPCLIQEESKQSVAYIGGRSSQCGTCRHYVCRRGSCLTKTMNCSLCGMLSCETCKPIEQCAECHRSCCMACDDMLWSCDKCANFFCINCLCGRYCVGDCPKALCGYCLQDCHPSIKTCDACMDSYCEGCRNVTECDICHLSYCESDE